MLHPAIIVRDSLISGKGLFATELIPAGTEVWRRDWDEPIYTRSEIESWTKAEREKFFEYAYQVGPDQFSGPKDGQATDPADYMNHSCDPTCWFAGDVVMVARRDILPGQEVTYDYAMSEIDPSYALASHCQTAFCRGVTRGSDCQLLPDLYQRYSGHMMDHVANTRSV